MKPAFSLAAKFAIPFGWMLFMLLAGLLLDRDQFKYALTGGEMSKKDEAEIKRTVEDLNRFVMDVSNSQGRTMSDAIPATKTMRHKLYMNTGFNTFGQRVMVYDLASLEIRKVVRTEPNMAEVVTMETWNYQYRNAASREEITSIKGMEDEFRYVMLKVHGKWLVHSFTPILRNKKNHA
jgi:hypothetical protein